MLRRLSRDDRGVAAMEFALVVGVLAMVLVNSVEVGKYYFEKMEVENAAQMATQAAWKTCDVANLPATVNCPGLNAAVTAALQATSLGAQVTQLGAISEGYYCVNADGELELVGNLSSRPANCASVGSASDQPGDYVRISAQYIYAPIFPAVGASSMLPATITATSIMRLQ